MIDRTTKKILKNNIFFNLIFIKFFEVKKYYFTSNYIKLVFSDKYSLILADTKLILADTNHLRFDYTRYATFKIIWILSKSRDGSTTFLELVIQDFSMSNKCKLHYIFVFQSAVVVQRPHSNSLNSVTGSSYADFSQNFLTFKLPNCSLWTSFSSIITKDLS